MKNPPRDEQEPPPQADPAWGPGLPEADGAPRAWHRLLVALAFAEQCARDVDREAERERPGGTDWAEAVADLRARFRRESEGMAIRR